MKARLLFVGVLLACVMWSCKMMQTPEEIFDQEKNGVVMVLNKYYYKVTLRNGIEFFFTGIDDEGGLVGFTEDENEVKKEPAMSFGTAFFIGDDGLLLTNRHVASPPIEEDEVKKNWSAMMNALQEYALNYQSKLEEAYGQAQQEAQSIVGYDEYGDLVTSDPDRLAELQQAAEEMGRQYEEAQNLVEAVEQVKDPSDMRIEPICELGIAYEGTSVSGERDFLVNNPCIVVRTSGDKEVDLALLKLKSGMTPNGHFVFDVNAAQDDVKLGDQLYMIGYNAGLDIATTNNGIQAQFTKGDVTQKPDGSRVLYSIATIQGSSGSPVINEAGELVAVNFAKFATGDNFNLGVPLEKIRRFVGNR